MRFFYTHIRAYQTRPKKQTGFSWPVVLSLRYTLLSNAFQERPQPPDCVPRIPLRHRTYSTKVTSFSRAISRFIANLCLSRTSLSSISNQAVKVKDYFTVFETFLIQDRALPRGLAFSFSFATFQNGHSCHQVTQQPGLVFLKLSALDLLSEMQNAT